MNWIEMKDDDGFEYLLQQRGNWEIEAYRNEEDCIARILLNSTCVKAIVKKDLLTAQNEAEDWVNRICKEWNETITPDKRAE